MSCSDAGPESSSVEPRAASDGRPGFCLSGCRCPSDQPGHLVPAHENPARSGRLEIGHSPVASGHDKNLRCWRNRPGGPRSGAAGCRGRVQCGSPLPASAARRRPGQGRRRGILPRPTSPPARGSAAALAGADVVIDCLEGRSGKAPQELRRRRCPASRRRPGRRRVPRRDAVHRQLRPEQLRLLRLEGGQGTRLRAVRTGHRRGPGDAVPLPAGDDVRGRLETADHSRGERCPVPADRARPTSPRCSLEAALEPPAAVRHSGPGTNSAARDPGHGRVCPAVESRHRLARSPGAAAAARCHGQLPARGAEPGTGGTTRP